jgi:acetyl-CoA C-acetyltransferase
MEECSDGVWCRGGNGGVKMNKVACIGAGMTLFRRRLQETGKEMCWEAANMALDQAGLTLKDIDMVVLGSAPDAFDGAKKPYMRVFTGGGTAVFTPIAAWWHIASGLAEKVLVLCEEKMSSVFPHPQSAFGHIWDPILDRPLKPNLVWIFAMEMNRYILNSEVMAWPVQRLDISPPSDGASALVMTSEKVAKKQSDDIAWVDGTGWCIDKTMWTCRDLYFPEYVAKAAKQAYKMAKIDNPRKQINIAEPYDPFDYKECHHTEGLLLCDKGKAPSMTKEGITYRDGDLPICPSGGLLGVGNPIAATMGIKVGELYWQLTQQAGKRQVKNDPDVGVCQAWGDLMQYGSVLVMRRG